MPEIVWNKVGDRSYESGLDRGVLYLPDGSAVPWNGLTSVIEKFDKTTAAVYYDGMKISDAVILGDFAATMKAVTYPDEFVELEGVGSLRHGVFLGDQAPKSFGLCYRTQVGNDLEGDTGYKIHILYNVTAIPHDKTYASLSDAPSLVEFEWDIVAVPEEVAGFRPTAHIVINSLETDPWLMEDLNEKLYGSGTVEASLIPMPDLITFMREWYRVKITDNGDGTWTAISQRDGFISFLDGLDTIFQIVEINAIYLDDITFQISDTIDVSDVPQIRIVWHPDGTWSAVTDGDGLIIMTNPTTFEILNANATFLGDGMYRISDTVGNT